MQLFLMRHAEALAQSEWDRGDSSRPLSESGTAQLERALPFLKRAAFPAKTILTSPYVRAKQTAELLAELVGWDNVVNCPLLASGAPTEAYQATILQHQAKEPLLVVGHLPEISLFASYLLRDPLLMRQSHMMPGEMFAIQLPDINKEWVGDLLWRRTLKDWEKV